MVSLLADIAICAAIIAGAYLWLGGRSSPGATSSSKKKKNKSKSKAKAAVNDVALAVVSEKQPQSQKQPAKQASLEKEKPATVQPVQQEQPHVKNGATQKPKAQQATKNRHTQGQAWRANEEFPPLSAAVKQSQPQKPLAERHAKPVPKTAVDDMLDREVEPERTFSRTMRIVKPAQSPPLLIDEPGEDDDKDNSDPFSERDSRTEKEPAWESVPITSQKKPPTIRIGISPSSSGSSTPARSIPGLTEQSKKQRQNAAKAAAAKAAKEAAEQDRLQRLAMHKRQLEKERINSQAKEREKMNGSGKGRTNRETLSGGMTAKVAENGALIWD